MALLEWRHAIAGGIAGVATVMALHPLDVVKTRIQVQDGYGRVLPAYRGTAHCIKTIVTQEGWGALYSGLLPTLMGSGISWGLYFMFYNGAKARWLQMTDRDELSPPQHLMSGMEAGCLASLVTNPLWVIKTRLQLQRGGGASVLGGAEFVKSRYGGLVDAVSTIARQEGLAGFYKGISASLLLVSHGAIQFMVYEELRSVVMGRKSVDGKRNGASLSSVEALGIGALSKLVASVSTYPLQVVRSRLQQRFDVGRGMMYSSTRQAIISTISHEGWRGLYKGMIPNLLRVMPQAAITFMVYEKAIQVIEALS
ncbi:hypothetical protein BSKO_13970 [Bryopsis sp. KO-2023]|nr:hypothetical protein BSKO_13970 [Bryopsis sp. KO-2023]